MRYKFTSFKISNCLVVFDMESLNKSRSIVFGMDSMK